MTTIRFENITKSFGSTLVIPELSLTIKDGEFFTFVGPSGCGKSTVLHMIAGLEPPSKGLVLFDGEPVNRLGPKERDIALVFQSYALYPHMTALENIAFPLRMKKQPKSEINAQVQRTAELLGILDLLGKKPKELSGGQRQRVALGRAIVRRPKVFLMDEPLSNLDARLRMEMRAELKRLHQELGITTVYVTHDQSEAMGLSDRIAVLNKGAVQQCDTPGAVYRYPANTFVAGFIGIPAMNLFPGTVVREQPAEVDCGGFLLSPKPEAGALKTSVLVGARPEDVFVSRKPTQGGVQMRVSVVEPAGSITWVEVLFKNLRITAMSKPDEGLRPGDECHAAFSEDKMLLFDAVSGSRL